MSCPPRENQQLRKRFTYNSSSWTDPDKLSQKEEADGICLEDREKCVSAEPYYSWSLKATRSPLLPACDGGRSAKYHDTSRVWAVTEDRCFSKCLLSKVEKSNPCDYVESIKNRNPAREEIKFCPDSHKTGIYAEQ